MSTSSSQNWDPIWFDPVQVLCGLPQSVSLCVHQPCGQEALCPQSHPSSLVLTVFLPPLPHRPLSPEGRALMKTARLEWGAPESPTLPFK